MRSVNVSNEALRGVSELLLPLVARCRFANIDRTNWVTINSPSMLTIPFAIALHNSCAGFGQIIAQWIWRAPEKAQGYPTGNFVCAACSFLVAAIATSLRLWYGHMNRNGMKDARGEKRIWAY